MFVSCTSVALRGHRRSPWSSLTSRWLHARRTTGTVFPMCSRTGRARLQAAAELSLPNSRCYASRRRPSWRQGRRSPTWHATLGRAMAPGLLDSSAQRVVELPPDLPRGDCRVGTIRGSGGVVRAAGGVRDSCGGWRSGPCLGPDSAGVGEEALDHGGDAGVLRRRQPARSPRRGTNPTSAPRRRSRGRRRPAGGAVRRRHPLDGSTPSARAAAPSATSTSTHAWLPPSWPSR